MSITKIRISEQLCRSRRDLIVRKIKKFGPLCVSKGFLEYAQRQQWDSRMMDAAALIMHYYYMHLEKISKRGWMPIPYQVFMGLFGRDYKNVKDILMSSGFLIYNNKKKYSTGNHYYSNFCMEFMICDELRYNRVSASYRLQTKELQELYLKRKEYWKNKTVRERKELADKEMEIAFIKSKNDKSYYWLLEKGYLTIEQYETIQKLANNALSLKLCITEEEVLKIASERYRYKDHTEKENYDFEAYLQRQQGKANSVLEVKISIDHNGRFYTPMTNVPREYWDYINYNGKQLAGVDVGNSHVNCLLMLIKDLQINYFSPLEVHDDRLDNCQFRKQISRIPALVEYLHYNSIDCNLQLTDNDTGIDTDNKELNIETRSTIISPYIESLEYTITICAINKPYYYIINNTNLLTIPYSQLYLQLEYHNVNPGNLSLYVYRIFIGFTPQTTIFLGQSEFLAAYCISYNYHVERINPVSQSDRQTTQNLFFLSQEDILEFEKILENDLYKRLMDSIGIGDGMEKEEYQNRRNQFKRDFFHFLYRPALCRYIKTEHWVDGKRIIERKEDQVRKAFKELLPSITSFLDMCKCKPGTMESWPKKDYYKHISNAMMSIESQIILETCANLWKKYPKMFLATVHDCIKCLPKDVGKVKEELNRTFGKYHVSPRLDVKIHSKPDNTNKEAMQAQ